MVAVQVTVRLVTKVPFPSTLTDAGVRMIHAVTVETSCHGFTYVTVLTSPSIVAHTFIGCNTLTIGAVGAAGDITVCSFPSLVTVAFKSVVAITVITSWQWDANVAVGTFPSYFTGTEVWCSTFPMDTSKSIVVTDRFKAWVQLCLVILNFRLFPS